MNLSLETSPVHQGSCQVGLANDEEHSAPLAGRQDARQLVIRAGGIPPDAQNVQQYGEVSWAVNEGTHILPHRFVDLGVADASATVSLHSLYSHEPNHLKILCKDKQKQIVNR